MTSFLSVHERVREQDEQTELLGGTADRRRRSGLLVYNEKFHETDIARLLIRVAK